MSIKKNTMGVRGPPGVDEEQKFFSEPHRMKVMSRASDTESIAEQAASASNAAKKDRSDFLKSLQK